MSGCVTGKEQTQKKEDEFNLTIVWDSTGSGIWIGYLASRAVYVEEHADEYDLQPGLLLPQFEEEVEARKTVAQIYSEMQQADSELVVPYFEDLSVVVEAGFIREYVWIFLRGEKWRKEPHSLRLEKFDNWRLEHIPEHQPVTRGKLRVE